MTMDQPTEIPDTIVSGPVRVAFERPAYGLVGRLLVDAGLALTGAANQVADAGHRGIAYSVRQASRVFADLGDAYYRRAGAWWDGDRIGSWTPMYPAGQDHESNLA